MNQTIYTKARPAIGPEEVRKAAQTLEQSQYREPTTPVSLHTGQV